MKQLLIILAWLLVCIGGFACTQMETQDSRSSPLAGEPASPRLAPDEGQLPQAVASLTTTMQIVAQRDLTLGGLRIVSLSPDGQWLLAYGSEDLCVLASTTVSVPTCVKWLVSLGYNMAWSPDSRYVAVTENFEKYFWESDIWLFDVEEGTLQDLTDDGVSGDGRWVIEPPVTLPVDLLPAWSTDGKSLVFTRSMRVKEGDGTGTWAGTDLVTMALPDQPIRKLVTVDNHEPAVVSTFAGLHWAQAGEALLFTYFGAHRGEKDGVWVFRPNENRLDHLLANDPEKGPPLLLQVAADGHTALIWYFLKALPYGGEPPPNVALMALFDLETGVVQDLVPSKPPGGSFAGPLNATFSPDGTKLLFVYRGGDQKYHLVLRTLWSQEDVLLMSSDQAVGLRGAQPGMTWGKNDMVFLSGVPDAESSGTLLQLGHK